MSNRAGNQAPRGAPAATGRPELIRELHENDVLLGRGKSHEYIGNKRLHDLATSRKVEYNSSKSHKVKNRIGREIYDEIVNRGGRFLQQAGYDGRATSMNKARGVLYEEVPRKKGEEKCKQLLREKSSVKEKQGTATSSETNVQDVSEEDFGENHDDSVDDIPPPDVAVSGRSPFACIDGGDATWFEFEGIHFPEVSRPVEESSSPISPSLSPLLPPTISENLCPIDTCIGLSPLGGQAPSVASRNDRATLESTSHIETFGEEDKEQAHSLDDDVAVSFLAALGLGLDQPRFSEHDQIQERATLTEEERISILVDLFGDRCSITEHQSKRRQSDTDRESVSFLLKQMRDSIDMMQVKKKEAFLEAQEKASPEEFSDSRLEQFLRSDGLNPELAARRFVQYWTSRRELFGEEKYTKRMVLSEAFCDDIAALQAGVFTLLPKRDSSGRHLMYIEGARLSDVEYDPDSMVRAYWYLVEIVVQEGGSGFVVLDWLRNASLFDFDRHVFLPIIYLCNNCWPIRPLPGHTCCPPKILVWLFTPIAFAMQGRELRVRNTIHDVPSDQVAESLLPFGITKEMLPAHMGGSLELNPSDWIAKRRAMEMKEIE